MKLFLSSRIVLLSTYFYKKSFRTIIWYILCFNSAAHLGHTVFGLTICVVKIQHVTFLAENKNYEFVLNLISLAVNTDSDILFYCPFSFKKKNYIQIRTLDLFDV